VTAGVPCAVATSVGGIGLVDTVSTGFVPVFSPSIGGFVVVGTQGTIASFDYEDHVSVQTPDCPAGAQVPVDVLPLSEQNGVANFIHALDIGASVEGPISPAISRAGQCVVDAAMISAREHRTVELGASL